jgi:hypothetical protein
LAYEGEIKINFSGNAVRQNLRVNPKMKTLKQRRNVERKRREDYIEIRR